MSETQSPQLEPAHPSQAITHALDPEKVKLSINKKIADHLQQKAYHVERAAQNCKDYAESLKDGKSPWFRPPDTPEIIGQIYDEMCVTERDHYATVRVVEIPQKGKRFKLVYGPVPTTEGTGPFATYDEACGWFYRGGR